MRPLLLALVFLAGGCTAAKATMHIVSAEQAVTRAEEHRAPDLAKYEYTLAVRYLEKAREEAGYSDYKEAEQLAKQSADYADQAIIAIERGGRDLDLDDAGSDLSDTPTMTVPAAAPASEPAPAPASPPPASEPAPAADPAPGTPSEPAPWERP